MSLRGLVAAWLLLSAGVAFGQPRVQFPSMVPEGSPYTAAPSAPSIAPPPGPTYTPPPAGWDPYGAAGTPPPAAPAYGAPPQAPETLYGKATRFLQEIDLDSAYLAGNNTGNNLGINDEDISATFAIPVFRNPFLVTPGFAVHLWDGPNSNNFAGSPDMPPRTYDAFLDATWKPQITPRLSADLAFRAGIYTDFDFVSSRSVRFPSRGLGLFAINPNLQLVAGVVYFDRLSVRILPAGGVIWMPTPDTRWEVLFPRPKLSQRITTIRNSNLWGYVSGEYGGNTWTIRRADGSGDVVDYNDLRLILGTEAIGYNGTRGYIEVGYVFNRRILYRSGIPTPHFHDTVMVRAGIAF
ncbi:MAG: hypothetical protein HYX69_19575 [Planctomycetia bacterium]|nr:hypothetical protein [Planctomycetia bacterium]